MPKLDATKLSALKNLLKKNNLDGIVISDYTDMKYVLGEIFLPGEAVLLAHKKGIYVTSRSLYAATVKAAYPQIKIEACDSHRELKITETAKKLGLKKISFDKNKEIYVAGAAYAAAGFEPSEGLMESLRTSKTKSELLTMRKATEIALATFTHIQKFLKPGVTEKQIAAEMDNFMKSKGASGVSFDTMVSFGAASANPHYSTGDAKLKKNTVILFDYGCIYKGYCSDMTRTIWFGGKPSAEFKKVYSVVKGAYDAVVKNAKEGMLGEQIDSIARNYIKEAGYGQYFTHGLGHGIGMNIHEEAYVNPENGKKKIMRNYCFSVEPGVYLTGKFGVRYEDCYYMTPKGINLISKAK